MERVLRLFISHSDEDKEHRDALVQHLCVLQQQGKIEVWDEGQIEPGAERHASIENSIDNCDVAVLLVSAAYLACKFINSVILTRLASRYQREKIRIVPVILSDCDWQTGWIGVFKPFPSDKRLTFTKLSIGNGRRAEAWAQLVQQIARWCHGNQSAADARTIRDDFHTTYVNHSAFSILGRMRADEIHGNIAHYKTEILRNPNDDQAIFCVALCYLQLQLYDLAIRSFRRCLELVPDKSEYYYYYALAMIRGRRPMSLHMNEVREIEKYINTAIQLDGFEAKYYYLLSIIRYDYYAMNGLRIPHPTTPELISQAQDKNYDPWEIERMLTAILFKDESVLSLIRKSNM